MNFLNYYLNGYYLGDKVSEGILFLDGMIFIFVVVYSYVKIFFIFVFRMKGFLLGKLFI